MVYHPLGCLSGSDWPCRLYWVVALACKEHFSFALGHGVFLSWVFSVCSDCINQGILLLFLFSTQAHKKKVPSTGRLGIFSQCDWFSFSHPGKGLGSPFLGVSGHPSLWSQWPFYVKVHCNKFVGCFAFCHQQFPIFARRSLVLFFIFLYVSGLSDLHLIPSCSIWFFR